MKSFKGILCAAAVALLGACGGTSSTSHEPVESSSSVEVVESSSSEVAVLESSSAAETAADTVWNKANLTWRT